MSEPPPLAARSRFSIFNSDAWSYQGIHSMPTVEKGHAFATEVLPFPKITC